ncbi:hypothetical protein BMJ23_25465 [Sinorhizobium medicae]|uniref:S8/S53 family peptidase n=1 Tax=Sinorhizobium medicae TaxID=110321 RepID=UPI000C7B3C0E|nr:S8/S53 family peptidase [Sinorhizobium medicae]PLU51914.1 hypothetical protein BMJ23_25465 [Sinorhizobium medicae]
MKWLMFAVASVVTATEPVNVCSQELDHEILSIEAKNPATLAPIEAILMRYGGPVPVIVGASDTYRDVINRECPLVTDAYLIRAASELEMLNDLQSVNLDAKVSADLRRIYLPYCIGSSLRYIVQSQDSLWRIFQQQQGDPDGVSDWGEFLRRFLALNKDSNGGNLPAGKSILLPKDGLKIPLPKDRAAEAVKELRATDQAPKIEMRVPANWGALEADSEEGDVCGAAYGGAYEREEQFARVSRVLALNSYLDDHHTWDRSKEHSVVGVFDSGIDGGSTPVMKNAKRKLSSSVTPADLEVLPDQEQKYHGSGIMSVAVGGHLFAQLNPLYSLVETAPYRIVDEECVREPNGKPRCAFVSKEERLLNALNMAAAPQSEIGVVNLSAAFPREVSYFQNFLGSQTPYLLVIAAGNNGKELGKDTTAYPAMKGGDDLSNLITVAGLDLDGNLVESSNRSARYVDIAAWGCDVPVLEYDSEHGDFSINTRTGTSYAAPQVSFIAAVLMNERKIDGGGVTPYEIKKRLIFSSDIRGELWSSIRHGRSLNPTKALSVYSDVVELTDGRMIWGKVFFSEDEAPNSSIDFCPDVTLKRDAVRKITRLEQMPDPPDAQVRAFLIYGEDMNMSNRPERKIDTLWCDSIFPDVSITNILTEKTETFEKDAIRDIVFAAYPYWEK